MPQVPRIQVPFSAGWSPACWAFYEHWKTLREEDALPTSEAFLDNMPLWSAAFVYMVEVFPAETIVRFQGTELVRRWGMDLTGKDLVNARSKDAQRRMAEIMQPIVNHPCGYFARMNHETSHHRTIEVRFVRLPLAVKQGRPPRVVAYTHEGDTLEGDETGWASLVQFEHDWFDIGFGVPPAPPVMLVG